MGIPERIARFQVVVVQRMQLLQQAEEIVRLRAGEHRIGDG